MVFTFQSPKFWWQTSVLGWSTLVWFATLLYSLKIFLRYWNNFCYNPNPNPMHNLHLCKTILKKMYFTFLKQKKKNSIIYWMTIVGIYDDDDDDHHHHVALLAQIIDLPDPISPTVSIVHRSRQVFKAISCIGTELPYTGPSWLLNLCSSMWRGPQEYIDLSSFLLLQQCPAYLVRLIWIVFVMGNRWP